MVSAGVDAVVGPASDGGYYLIGLREPRAALFAVAGTHRPRERRPEVLRAMITATVARLERW